MRTRSLSGPLVLLASLLLTCGAGGALCTEAGCVTPSDLDGDGVPDRVSGTSGSEFFAMNLEIAPGHAWYEAAANSDDHEETYALVTLNGTLVWGDEEAAAGAGVRAEEFNGPLGEGESCAETSAAAAAAPEGAGAGAAAMAAPGHLPCGAAVHAG